MQKVRLERIDPLVFDVADWSLSYGKEVELTNAEFLYVKGILAAYDNVQELLREKYYS